MQDQEHEAEQSRPEEGPRWVLPSGASNGAALVGMFEALQASDDFQFPDEINGASTGAFVGVCIACGMSANEIMEMLKAAPLDETRVEDGESPEINRRIFQESLKRSLLASVHSKLIRLKTPGMSEGDYQALRRDRMQSTFESFATLREALPEKHHQNPGRLAQARGAVKAMRAKSEKPDLRTEEGLEALLREHASSMAGGGTSSIDELIDGLDNEGADLAVIQALFLRLDEYFQALRAGGDPPIMPSISFQDLHSLQRQYPGQFSRLSTASVTSEQKLLIFNAVFTPDYDVAEAATNSATIPGIFSPKYFGDKRAFDGGFLGIPACISTAASRAALAAASPTMSGEPTIRVRQLQGIMHGMHDAYQSTQKIDLADNTQYFLFTNTDVNGERDAYYQAIAILGDLLAPSSRPGTPPEEPGETAAAPDLDTILEGITAPISQDAKRLIRLSSGTFSRKKSEAHTGIKADAYQEALCRDAQAIVRSVLESTDRQAAFNQIHDCNITGLADDPFAPSHTSLDALFAKGTATITREDSVPTFLESQSSAETEDMMQQAKKMMVSSTFEDARCGIIYSAVYPHEVLHDPNKAQSSEFQPHHKEIEAESTGALSEDSMTLLTDIEAEQKGKGLDATPQQNHAQPGGKV